MSVPQRLKIRLGSSNHLTVCARRRHGDPALPYYDCSVRLRMGSTRAVGHGDSTFTALNDFCSDVVRMTHQLAGSAKLKPATAGDFELEVSIGPTGDIVTRATLGCPTNLAPGYASWILNAQFSTRWTDYFRPMVVDGWAIPRLILRDGRGPQIEEPV